MMDKFKDYIIMVLVSGLFLICIIGFLNGMGDEYEVDMSTPYVDTSRVESQLNDTSEDANAWAESFKSDSLFVTTGVVVLLSVWSVINTVWDAVITFIVIYLDIFTVLFGIPPIVTGTITAMIIISLIFLAWKTVKQG